MTHTPLLQNRIALITGASRGIGAAVATCYAQHGAHVILVARTVGGLEEIDDTIQKNGKGKATLVPLDLLQADAIDQLGQTIAERFGKLDILVGNAGMLGSLGPVAHTSPENWDNILNLNLTVNFRLIRSLDPLLRQSDAGRAIFVTSGVTNSIFPYWGPYTVSKCALEALVNTYAKEVEKTNIKVNVIDPGIVQTAMRASAFPGEDPQTLSQPEEITDMFVELALPSSEKTGQRVAA